MDLINRSVTRCFDAALRPLEFFGEAFALVCLSGVFGVIALICFKRISWQDGIKAAKDKIKGHVIAIRIYQDDLGIVFVSVGKILLRNAQYLGLNCLPVLPLMIPFVLVAAQFVVRYAFAPVPVMAKEHAVSMLPGRGNFLEIKMRADRKDSLGRLQIGLPPELVPLSPLVRNMETGLAVIEFAAIAPGKGSIEVAVDGQVVETKEIVCGEHEVSILQPERASGLLASLLWPAEPTLSSESPIALIRFTYPSRDLGFLPGGPGGVLLTFFLASILFGLAVLKPLNIQI